MKKISLLLLTLISLPVLAQNGVVKESVKIKSEILGKEMKYNIYLPADYEKTNRSYPVLYLLHGYSDDETGWTQFGAVEHIADKAIAGGDAPPMIIVMPDAGVTFYMNSYDGKAKFEDYFIQEFMPHIESTYRIRQKKEFRAVAGLSMGGFGTMLLATKHTDLFAAAAPLSGAFWTDDEIANMPAERWSSVFLPLFGPLAQGKSRLSPHWYANSIFKIIETAPLDKLKSVKYYIDCGDDDFLVKGNMALHSALLDKAVPHEFRIRDGAHTWQYWRTSLPEVLKFVGQSFHR
ncbi:Carbohydrate acetyl esterase/feruloyl esterase [Dyadobacter sp. CECT 9275]|uniref:Carbohydrate acetyl esterase/feruloyl esterase n=1 Tax=Dyadobacter helix TaxID=2822344 RepID=A0A916JF72_9BACT|nr:alpha/beta hydrolase-fold protein [Dyadobacter sp. CECT 9275]CAG5005449.1 Carbohydrate acetyl esterase/feruloyl esterase [Dyadobacter sp. CECT 9275]